jgi:hypothetical protein
MEQQLIAVIGAAGEVHHSDPLDAILTNFRAAKNLCWFLPQNRYICDYRIVYIKTHLVQLFGNLNQCTPINRLNRCPVAMRAHLKLSGERTNCA